ncbi:MAG: hypothetical protein JRJ60_23625 [Deltaproteobacteria bacterium]|nr:hypothetical protein [Deltaproteobacteria bacterium]
MGPCLIRDLPGFQWVAGYRKAYQLKPATFVVVVVVVIDFNHHGYLR